MGIFVVLRAMYKCNFVLLPALHTQGFGDESVCLVALFFILQCSNELKAGGSSVDYVIVSLRIAI